MYAPLEQFLQNYPAHLPELTLTFAEIEQIIDHALPASAHNHHAWWANQANYQNRPQARAWMGAGFRIAEVQRPNGWVRFVREPA